MAYKVIILYRLYMPSYFLGTFTEYPELKGFQKVQLAPGETQYVSFIVDQNSLSYFNDTLHKWIAEAGEFEAIIGSSSEEIKARINFELK